MFILMVHGLADNLERLKTFEIDNKNITMLVFIVYFQRFLISFTLFYSIIPLFFNQVKELDILP